MNTASNPYRNVQRPSAVLTKRVYSFCFREQLGRIVQVRLGSLSIANYCTDHRTQFMMTTKIMCNENTSFVCFSVLFKVFKLFKTLLSNKDGSVSTADTCLKNFKKVTNVRLHHLIIYNLRLPKTNITNKIIPLVPKLLIYLLL